ncbi:hypothetical protein WJX77_008308 [Trebouxia sp. C0004]
MSTSPAHRSAAPLRANVTAAVRYRASLSLWPERLCQLKHSCIVERSNRGRPCKLSARKVTASAATAVLLDKTDSTTVLPPHAFPALPLCLLLGLAAAWVVTVRCSLATQCSALLLLEAVYAGLHLQPLLPLFLCKGSPDIAFMQSYTKAIYFVSECILLLWLFTNSVIRVSIPSTVVALHGAVHILFVGLAGCAPAWCMQQQVQRIQNGWNVKELVGIWHVMVNMVNFADLLLHLSYITVLWQGLIKIAAAGAVHALWHQPAAVASVGVGVAFMMARWLPRSQDKRLLVWLPVRQQHRVDSVHVLNAPHPAPSFTVFLHIEQYHVIQDALVSSYNLGLSEWEVTISIPGCASASGANYHYN